MTHPPAPADCSDPKFHPAHCKCPCLPETMFRTTDFDDSTDEDLIPVKSWRYVEDDDDPEEIVHDSGCRMLQSVPEGFPWATFTCNCRASDVLVDRPDHSPECSP